MSGVVGASGLAQLGREGLGWIRSWGGPEATSSPMASNPRLRSLLSDCHNGAFEGGFQLGSSIRTDVHEDRLEVELGVDGKVGKLRQGEVGGLL